MGQTILIPGEKYLQDDETFHELYPLEIRHISTRHWTPLRIVRKAVSFLSDAGSGRILDIGSGAGKFCIAGAMYMPQSDFFGIEQRRYLVEYGNNVQDKIGLDNVTLIEGNFTSIDFKMFDHFYFFNSFWENIDGNDKIDDSIEYSESLYSYYVAYLRNILDDMPKGTRIVTYHSLLEEIPPRYALVATTEEGMLNFWEKR